MQSFFVLLISSLYLLNHFIFAQKEFQTVYVGLKNETRPQALKPLEELASGDQFGQAVAIWEDICIVSATKRAVLSSSSPVHADLDGVVFVFQQDENRQWADTGRVLASSVPEDGFGESLSIYRGTAAVGAPKDDTLGENSGLVYVYYTTTSSSGEKILGSYQTLKSEQQKAYDYFGYSVAVVPGDAYYSHGTVLVGAYGHDWDGKMIDSGAVFIFANSGTAWYQVTMIQPSQPYMNGHFGWSISGYGNAVAVGAPGQESVFLFHLEPVQTECPHDRPPDQMPVACQNQHFRTRKLQGEPAHHTYSTWNYVEVLHVQNSLETNKGELFGTSVAVINETVLTLVVGAPYDNTGGTACGAIVILTQLPKSDIWNSWTPGNPSGMHVQSNENNLRNDNSEDSRRLQPQQGANDPRYNIWKVRSNTYTTDKDGSYWMISTKVKGSSAMERFGQSVAVSENHIIVGTHPGTTKRGTATVLVFNSTNIHQTDSPIYRGPLFMKEWVKETSLFDYGGGVGDYFGYTVGIYKETAVVGAFLTGFKSEWNIGTGGAYIYDAIQLVPVTEASTSSSSSTLSISNPFLRVLVYSTFVGLIFVVFGGLLFILKSNLLSNSTLTSINYPSSKDLDSSEKSLDSIEMSSSHPLTAGQEKKNLPSHNRSGGGNNSGQGRYEVQETLLPSSVQTKYPENTSRRGGKMTQSYLHNQQNYGQQHSSQSRQMPSYSTSPTSMQVPPVNSSTASTASRYANLSSSAAYVPPSSAASSSQSSATPNYSRSERPRTFQY